ncbi:beta-N-acetylhexosaminidase [Pedobacter frigoris]|uniref:beta-N-acetylhexosaminidase n=1 Tax=Pedobacter frigoris TaxID=2571272 RepID=A0A4U1CU55_9SPHI|nr:beta-N-acetylhexosaminidase [Pedobacter frigoris]TKC09529.1 beta-N-acetylhexosaminidase [Pedobacter frigoris]
MLRYFWILLFSLNVSAQVSKTSRPALIPLPNKIEWGKAQFNLKSYKKIVITDAKLRGNAIVLQEYLRSKGVKIPIVSENKDKLPAIILETSSIASQEAYRLDVGPKAIQVKASGDAGMFYGIQTLKQLVGNANKIGECHIEDAPAFAWRGYMIDAGRNFMPMDLLKQQIDVMASYKLNIFHFHFTEDIAWRLESKLYPQLTNPETMIRNKGQFYTQNDLKELIAYCKARQITLIPEIDMPGHSAAFKRAMKMDMQSDSGLLIVKKIIKEFCATYDVEYLHIGADEVKITNKNFLPEVTALIEQLGKKVIGWEPGGNFTESTIRQLWMEGATKVSTNPNIKYIDSRHLYLNHMDPLESVATIFHRKIANLDKGNSVALGGIICMWPDRRVNIPQDVFTQNPVYPAMLAFAERSWKGGGLEGWQANIGLKGSAEAITFSEFENRLLVHKKLHFGNIPFPYVKQCSTTWKLYGPYENGGDLDKRLDPEFPGFDANKMKPTLTAIGGTVVLRHWWAPQVKGLLETPKENTTWYAVTQIWSDENKIQDFWIGFNNISRSYASSSPKSGTWDNRKSAVYVNNELIPPPAWKQAGMEGDLEKPLVDEGYEFREPTKIQLKKGWNKILVKLPIASFRGIDWKNPEKWMFTVVPWR